MSEQELPQDVTYPVYVIIKLVARRRLATENTPRDFGSRFGHTILQIRRKVTSDITWEAQFVGQE